MIVEMTPVYRILGQHGRVTIPCHIRLQLGFVPNSVVSFTVTDDRTVVVRRETLQTDAPAVNNALIEFLSSLSEQQKQEALVQLTVSIGQKGR